MYTGVHASCTHDLQIPVKASSFMTRCKNRCSLNCSGAACGSGRPRTSSFSPSRVCSAAGSRAGKDPRRRGSRFRPAKRGRGDRRSLTSLSRSIHGLPLGNIKPEAKNFLSTIRSCEAAPGRETKRWVSPQPAIDIQDGACQFSKEGTGTLVGRARSIQYGVRGRPQPGICQKQGT